MRPTGKALILSLGADLCITPGVSIVGGQANFAKNLATRLADRYSVTAVHLAFLGSTERVCQGLSELNIVEIPLPGEAYGGSDLWRVYPQIERLAAERLVHIDWSATVVVSVYWLSGLWMTQQQSIRPRLWIHSAASYAIEKRKEHSHSKGRHRYLAFREAAEQTIASSTDLNWATNKYEANLLASHFNIPENRVLKLPRPLNLLPCSKPSKTLWDVAYLGRLDARKGIYDIPEILRRLPRSLRPRTVLVGGSCTESEEYAAWFSTRYADLFSHLKPRFLPAVPHRAVTELLSRTRVVLVPSHSETFGNVVLEAAASGVAVVASAVGGIPELLPGNPFLFPPGDFETASANLMRALCGNEAPGQSARLQERHSWSRILRCLTETIDAQMHALGA